MTRNQRIGLIVAALAVAVVAFVIASLGGDDESNTPAPPKPEVARIQIRGGEVVGGSAEIKVKKDRNPALWITYADGLRDASLKALKAANMKNATVLFQVSDGIDTACENCHLEYWYPGDRKAVLEKQNSRSTPGAGTQPPK